MYNCPNNIFKKKLEFSKFQEGFGTFENDDQQIKKLDDLVTTASSLKSEIDQLKRLKAELSADTTHNKLEKKQYKHFNDYNSTDLNYNKSANIYDAAKHDVDEMIVQQNNTYILGMITVTTLLISSFLFIRG